ncbi:MAG: cupredoxin domain-containing protein [Acidobacteriaceae bacterium]|nr:cupredoxin domain-containing protein [Acidobacteriaceae bacterium]
MTRTLLMLLLLLAPTSSALPQGLRQTIEIHARRFAFEPSEITLRKGHPATLRLISDDVTHSLVVRGLHINQEVSKGHPVEITITPANTGDFKGECGHFCGSGHASMQITIHVTE